MCERVAPFCTSGDRRQNVMCVVWCAEVRSFPAVFPADDVNCSTAGLLLAGGQAG